MPSDETASVREGRRGADREGEGYVHDPAAFRAGEAGEAATSEGDAAGARAADEEREFGWRGWVLVGFLLVAFFVVPGAILALPYVGGALGTVGLSFRDAYLVLPLLPALVLGALAVWATTRP